LGTRRFALAIAPFILVCLLVGWQTTRHPPRDLEQLIQFLRSREIHYGASDYWLSYQVTFLCCEDPVIVPLDTRDDRYEPYREAYLSAPVTALIFHPDLPQTRRETYEQYLVSHQIPFQTEHVGEFTVLIVTRRDPRVV
jgi:hypothetical protein